MKKAKINGEKFTDKAANGLGNHLRFRVSNSTAFVT